MDSILSFLSLYLFGFTLLTAYFGIYAAIRGETVINRIFTAFCALSGIYLLGYLMELNSATLERMIFWNGVQYIGLAFIPALWVVLAAYFEKPERRIPGPVLAGLCAMSVLTFILRMTNGQHYLFYTDMWINEALGLRILFLEKGPAYVLNSVFVSGCSLGATYFYLRAALRGVDTGKRVTAVFIFGSLLPWFALMMNLINIWGLGIDYIAIVTPLTLALIGMILSDRNFLRLKPLARDNVFEIVSEGIIVLDSQNCLADFNPAAAEIMNTLSRTRVGEPIGSVVPDCSALEKLVENGAPVEIQRIMGGKPRYFSARLSTVQNELRQHIGRIISLTDSTDKVETIHLLQENQQHIEHLSLHDQLTGLFNRRYYEEALLHYEARGQYPLTLMMADVNGLKLVNDAFGHTAGDRLLTAAGALLQRCCREGDVLARVGGDEFALILPQAGEREAAAFLDRLASEAARLTDAALPVSLSIGFGVRTRARQKMEDVQKQAEERMYKEKLVRSPQAKKRVFQAVVESLHRSSGWEKEHALRVGRLSARLGEALGMTPESCERLRLLGEVHDIGKVGIDEWILQKPAAVSDLEQDEIRRHPEIGYHILSSVSDYADLAPLVLNHHERWDGHGFPLGIAGPDIPLEARILAIADAYESLTSPRPYREQVGRDKALAEIEKSAGTQFDPRLADLFVTMMGQEALDVVYV